MADITIPGYDKLKNLGSHCIGGCLDEILALDMVADKQFDDTYFLVTHWDYDNSDSDDATITVMFKTRDRSAARATFDRLVAESEDR